jgi:hypothetical protein
MKIYAPPRESNEPRLLSNGAERRKCECIVCYAVLVPEDLARIHNIVGVDRGFECAHDAHRLAMLGENESVKFRGQNAIGSSENPKSAGSDRQQWRRLDHPETCYPTEPSAGDLFTLRALILAPSSS